MLNSYDTAFAVDIADLQMHRLGGPQSCGISCRQRRAGLQARNCFKKPDDLVVVQNNRQLGWRSGIGNTFWYLVMVKCDAIEETEGTDRLVQGGP